MAGTSRTDMDAQYDFVDGSLIPTSWGEDVNATLDMKIHASEITATYKKVIESVLFSGALKIESLRECSVETTSVAQNINRLGPADFNSVTSGDWSLHSDGTSLVCTSASKRAFGVFHVSMPGDNPIAKYPNFYVTGKCNTTDANSGLVATLQSVRNTDQNITNFATVTITETTITTKYDSGESNTITWDEDDYYYQVKLESQSAATGVELLTCRISQAAIKLAE